jgi:hypothetical protein
VAGDAEIDELEELEQVRLKIGAMSPVDETRLRQLSDHAEIIDVQHRYATGVDTRNWEFLRTCFTDELEADFSSGFGASVVRLKANEWIESIAPVMGALKATQHRRGRGSVGRQGGPRRQVASLERSRRRGAVVSRGGRVTVSQHRMVKGSMRTTWSL